VTEENLEGFFVGRYEHAKPEVKQLFLFAYCDCAIEMMGKPVSEELNAKEYFQKFPEAGSSLVRVVLTTEAWEQAGKEKAQDVDPIKRMQPMQEMCPVSSKETENEGAERKTAKRRKARAGARRTAGASTPTCSRVTPSS